MSMLKIADRHRTRGGRRFALLSCHGVRALFGHDIHADKRRKTHVAHERKRRERLQYNLFQRRKEDKEGRRALLRKQRIEGGY